MFLLFILKLFAVKELKNHLCKDAKQNSYYIDEKSYGSFKTVTNYVPLQMDQYQPNRDLDETAGHQHTREEIIDRQKNCISGILPKDFFQRSRQHIQGTAEYRNARTKETKQNILEKKGNLIGVIGQAGVGKSTLMKDLFHRSVTGERLYRADFVFYVKLRDFFDKTKTNLFQFLMGKAAYDSLEWMKNSVIRKGVLKLLLESESVCILLDGLDEADIDVTHLDRESRIEFDIDSENSPKSFILRLLSGEIFPKAKKIITSRPSQMLDLPDNYKPKFIVKIFGIKQQDIKQICLDICDDDEYASQVLSQIERQPDLLSYCLVPINCVLIVNCFNRFQKEESQKFSLNNITDVFALNFFCFSKFQHKPENCKNFDIRSFNDLKKISKLAWTGIKYQKLYFDEEDLNAAGLNETDISSFTVAFNQKNKKNRIAVLENATKKCIYFSHLLLQEFFAAVFCLFFMNFFEFEATFFDSNQFSLINNQFEMITKFMFGLFNSQTIETLRKIYPNISKPTNHMKRLTEFATDFASTVPEEGNRFLKNKSTLVRVCCWAYETQDTEFCEKVAKSFPLNLRIFLDDDLLTSDILPLCYVIKARKKMLKLKILLTLNINIMKNLQLFCKEMESIFKNSSHIKVTYLHPILI